MKKLIYILFLFISFSFAFEDNRVEGLIHSPKKYHRHHGLGDPPMPPGVTLPDEKWFTQASY